MRRYALPAMQKLGPIEAWIVDDTGLVKKGTHSVGVAPQYASALGKTANCQTLVSLTLALVGLLLSEWIGKRLNAALGR